MTAKDEQPRRRRRVAPAYLKRKGAIAKDGKRGPDRAITYLWVNGKRRQIHLGVWMSPQSRERFARVMSLYVQGEEQAALEAARNERPSADATITVEELVGQFLRYAEGYYRKPDGRPTGEHRNFIDAVRPLLELYGNRSVEQFGCPELERVREHMIHPDGTGQRGRKKSLSIGTVNSRVQRIRRVFRWGVPKRLVSADTVGDLEQLEHLKRGRCREVREPGKVEPVAWQDVEPVLLHVPPTIRAMLLVQWHSGARPSEICNLRPTDIDRSNAKVWKYCPLSHKGEHLGKVREVPLDPQAQEALRPLLARIPKPPADVPLFSPALAQAERAAIKRAMRRSKVPPSQEERGRSRRSFGDRYTTNSYRLAIHYGIVAANGESRRRAIMDALRPEVPAEASRTLERCVETLPARMEAVHISKSLRRAAKKTRRDLDLDRLTEIAVHAMESTRTIERWGPHQIRHAFGFRMVPEIGVEHTRALMGHSDIRTTMRYAKSDVRKAFEALARIS